MTHKAAGRLPTAKLIFPNVELRLDVATAKGGFVNLASVRQSRGPEPHRGAAAPAVAVAVQRDAGPIRLHQGGPYPAGQEGRSDHHRRSGSAELLVRTSSRSISSKLREVFGESGWAKKNILIAVAGGATDGTSGVREAADQTIRREIEGFAHVIFAGSSAQREFWLGRGDLGPDEIRARYGGLKPCLHGSDAHKLDDVASPFGDRFSWIKGGLEFDALRQACIDPGGRAHVGAEPPASATPSQVISEVEVLDAPWMTDAGHSAQSGIGRHHRRSRFGEDRARRHDRGGMRFHLGRGLERRGVGQSLLPRPRPAACRRREGQGELGCGRAEHPSARWFGCEWTVQLRARAVSVAAVRRGAVLVERPDRRAVARDRTRDLRGAP